MAKLRNCGSQKALALVIKNDNSNTSDPARVFGELSTDSRERIQIFAKKKIQELKTQSEQSPVCNFKYISESIDLEDSNPSYHSPESVLFEWQSRELSCCKELSPKIVPRMTKIRLNLDLPEPSSDENDKNDSDHTNSITETKGQTFECPEKKFQSPENTESKNESVNNDVLDKTIPIDRVFDTTLEKAKELPRETSNCFDAIPSYRFTNLAVTSCITLENTKNDIFYNKKSFSFMESENEVVLPEPLLNCSMELPEEALLPEKSRTCDYFEIPEIVSKEPGRDCQNFVSNVDKKAGVKHLQSDDFHWYGRVVPSGKREKIVEIHSQTKITKSEGKNIRTNKRKSCENLNQQGNKSTDFFSSESPPIKRHRPVPKFENFKEPRLLLQPVEIHKPLAASSIYLKDKHSNKSAKNRWNENLMSDESATALDSDFKIMKTESYVTMDSESTNENGITKNVLLSSGDMKISLTKTTAFCQWITKKIIIILQKSYEAIRRILVSSLTSSRSNSRPQTDKELTHVMSLIRSENERILSVLVEKVNHLSNELVQVRLSNETILESLRTEIRELRSLSNKLTDNNEVLTKELTSFVESRDKFTPITSTKSAPVSAPPPPPPPLPPPLPPPPPPPLPSSRSISPTTPNSSRKRAIRTPTRKCSTPLLNSRPPITVEDLLKVTLKKAPQNNKENKKPSMMTPRGPVVSLDMLRSVKLKSARKKSNDYSSRSPRRAHSLKNHPLSSMSLSPIMAGGAVSPLSKILRQVESNPRRASKRRLSSPTKSDNDMTRESSQKYEGPRHKMSRSVIA